MMERVPVQPEIHSTAPVAVWSAGLAAPDFGALSYILRARRTGHPQMTWLVSATKRAGNLFNGHGGRMPREVERSHDVQLAGIYFWYRRHRPAELKYWVFEERIRRERRQTQEMLPDVLLRSPGRVRAVECGGKYNKSKLEKFHAYCSEQGWEYEIW